LTDPVPDPGTDVALYVHWPYCARICPYCDFNVVRDRGRIDPVTGEVRGAAGDEPAAPAPADPRVDELTAEVAERTADLQRVSAEYANYRRRVDFGGVHIAKIDTRGFLYELTPPVPVDVLPGNIRSPRKIPPANSVAAGAE